MIGSSGHNSEIILVNKPREFYCDALVFENLGLNSNNFEKRRFFSYAIIAT
ncbi:MAG: hypothetical protein JXA54_06800 [Candidatus Heimdallarchaeota archaeon]|nr:hypothetical protein [Candidatus Heimdallarchaeota archaeon]